MGAWCGRVLTISDHHVSSLLGEKLASLWRAEDGAIKRLVRRKHAVRFDKNQLDLQPLQPSDFEYLDVRSRVIRVEQDSFEYECDLIADSTSPECATMRGGFEYVDEAGKNQPLPDDVVATLRDRLEPGTFERGFMPCIIDASTMSLKSVRWSERESHRVVRYSDCDARGHLNNATLANLMFDILRGSAEEPTDEFEAYVISQEGLFEDSYLYSCLSGYDCPYLFEIKYLAPVVPVSSLGTSSQQNLPMSRLYATTGTTLTTDLGKLNPVTSLPHAPSTSCCCDNRLQMTTRCPVLI